MIYINWKRSIISVIRSPTGVRRKDSFIFCISLLKPSLNVSWNFTRVVIEFVPHFLDSLGLQLV